jgi:hypothetical protein
LIQNVNRPDLNVRNLPPNNVRHFRQLFFRSAVLTCACIAPRMR